MLPSYPGRRAAARSSLGEPDVARPAAPSTATIALDRLRSHLALLATAVVATGAIAHVLARGAAEGTVRRSLTRPLLLDAELALPAWFASAVLLAIAGCAWWLGELERHQRSRWRVLAAVFVVLSLDEAIVLHEMFDQMLADALGRSGGEPLWVFPAVVAVGVVGWYVLPLWRLQTAALRKRWVVALAAYGGGAVGIEFLSRSSYDVPSQASMGYIGLVVLEEGLELVGAIVFLTALLAAVVRVSGTLDLRAAADR